MITKNAWFTIAGMTLSLLGALIPSTALAQHSPGRHRPDSKVAYDTNTETTVEGAVADVENGRSVWSMLIGVHTLGLGHKGAREKQLLLKTDNGTLQVHLGPTTFLSEKKVEINKGDTLAVTGSLVTMGDVQVVLAREIRKADNTWALRDTTGTPLWSVAQTEPRGFWTKRTVIFVSIAAAKVVALATVLRH